MDVKEVRMSVSGNIVSLVIGGEYQSLYDQICERPEVYEIARSLVSEEIVIKNLHDDVDHIRMVGWVEGMMFLSEFLNEYHKTNEGENEECLKTR